MTDDKRRNFLKRTGAGFALGASSTTAIAQSPALQWRLACSFPKTLDALYGAAEFFAKRVAALTGNRFHIRVHGPDEIVPSLQVLDAVQNGTVECGHTASYYYVGKNPAFAFDTALPFGLNARQQNAWMYAGGGIQAMRGLFAEYGCVQFPAGNTGAQMGGWFRKEVKSLDDLKGLKFRIAGIAGQVLARLGAVPQQIAGPNIYQSLERGAIDAAEWVGPYDDEKLGFVKVAPYYYYPGFCEGSAQLSVLVNQKKWEELPAEYKAAVEAAATEAHVQMNAHYDARNPLALRKLVAAGAKLRAFPPAVMSAAQQVAFDLYDELAQKSPQFKSIYVQWKQFRQEELLWFRVAEHSYDNFIYSAAAKTKS
ncbi:MAG TPA: TRAP transporter substrate-binding protein [Burkholderiales bacterium]|nr:TRAP transporter substrate-binding protein [Burkholderiales bacterium]